MKKLIFVIIFLSSALAEAQTFIELKKENGVYTVPCKVNDLKLKFIFDTGASGVSLSATEAVFMLKNDYLNEDDILEKTKLKIANGEIIEGTRVVLRRIEIGNLVLEDVEATIVHTISAPLLLGQSVLEKLGKIEIDYNKMQLIINPIGSSAKIIDIENQQELNKVSICATSPTIEKKEVTADSINLLTKKTEERDFEAMAILSAHYRKGIGVKEDFEKAFLLSELAANNGSSYGLFNLGRLYEDGKGVEKDINKSIYLYKKAIELGNSDAMCQYGNLYYDGNGVEQDYEKAMLWYEKATKLNNYYAMSNIGIMYLNGFGVEKDYEKAKYWFEKAIVLGNSFSMYSMGILYFNGYGVEKDYEKAKCWYEKAAALDNNDAMLEIGSLYIYGYGVEKDYEKARNWYEQAAGFENDNAMNCLGNLYYSGDGVVQDIEVAKSWYEKAADLGNVHAMNNLGRLYNIGLGIKLDVEKSNYWFEKARVIYEKDAINGDDYSMNNLGEIYFYGYGVEKDDEKAKYWFEKSALLGYASAMINLGQLYNQGFYIENVFEQDHEKAKYWFEKAASLGNDEAYYNLGLIYSHGYGVETNIEMAIYWYEKAAHLGNENAIFNICMIYYDKGNYFEAKKWQMKSKSTNMSPILENIIEKINPENINGITLEKRKERVREISNSDYMNNWIYLYENKNKIHLFKDVKHDGYNLIFWMKTIPKKDEINNFKKEISSKYTSEAIKKEISTNLSFTISIIKLNCQKNEIGQIKEYIYGTNGNIIHSNDDENEMTDIIPDTVGEQFAKTICEYYNKIKK